MTASPRRWLILALAPLVAVSMVLVTPASPANAAPGDSSDTADDGDDNPLLQYLAADRPRERGDLDAALAAAYVPLSVNLLA